MTLKVNVVVGSVCLNTFNSPFEALRYVDRLGLKNFELTPAIQAPCIKGVAATAFTILVNNPNLTFQEFTTLILGSGSEDEFTTASMQEAFKAANHLYATFFPDRASQSNTQLAFTLFKESGYDWMAACLGLQAERNLSQSDAWRVALEVGLVSKTDLPRPSN